VSDISRVIYHWDAKRGCVRVLVCVRARVCDGIVICPPAQFSPKLPRLNVHKIAYDIKFEIYGVATVRRIGKIIGLFRRI